MQLGGCCCGYRHERGGDGRHEVTKASVESLIRKPYSRSPPLSIHRCLNVLEAQKNVDFQDTLRYVALLALTTVDQRARILNCALQNDS